MHNIKNLVITAENRIRAYIRETPLDFSLPLSRLTQNNIYLKCENLQYTGSFKTRGAFNKLLSLTNEQRSKGIIAASSGNHGAAIAYGLNILKIPGMIFVPENASTAKIENIHNYNVPLELHATDCMQTENYARAYANKNNMIYASPYNDIDVIAGQGTIAIELMQQLNKIDVVLVPIGGGGLISGIAGYLKSVAPKIKIIGCLPTHSPVMFESIKAGSILDMETRPTLSDATAGGIEAGAVTFELCKKFVDGYIIVSEDEIQQAIINLIKMQHMLIEGAAAVALASLLKNAREFKNKNIIVILSGANISLNTLKQIIT